MAVDAAQARAGPCPPGGGGRDAGGRRPSCSTPSPTDERRRLGVHGLQPQAQLVARRARRPRWRRADAGHRLPRDHPRRRRLVGTRPKPVELRDLYFLSPFVVGPGEVRTLKREVRPAPRRASLVFSDAEAAPHVTATVAPVESSPMPHPGTTSRHVRARCTAASSEFDGYSAQPFMDFGPRWGSLRSVEYGDGEALVTTVMPAEFVVRAGQPVAPPGGARRGHRQRPGPDPRLRPDRHVLRAVLLRPGPGPRSGPGDGRQPRAAAHGARPTTWPCSTSRSATSAATGRDRHRGLHDAPGRGRARH